MTAMKDEMKPMQGLAEWLRADALDANPRNAAKLNRWASEVESAELAATTKEPVAWHTVQNDGFPACDGHTTYIGINSAGYACCFNAMRAGTCVMETADGTYRQMSDLRDWRLLDRPADARSGADNAVTNSNEKEGDAALLREALERIILLKVAAILNCKLGAEERQETEALLAKLRERLGVS
jgi:hypothetical protein